MKNKKKCIIIISLLIFGLLEGVCAGAPVEKDTFIVAVGQDVAHVDPHKIGAAGAVWYFTHRGLTAVSLLDQRVAPALAESWEMVDPTTWRFTLRKGVKYSNGKTMTSADVKFSFYRFLGRLPGRFPAAGKRSLAFIDTIETPDDHTLIFKTKHPEASFLSILRYAAIIPKAYVESVGADGYLKKPVGAGPFRTVEHSRQEFIKLEANEYYETTSPGPHALALAKIKTVIYRLIPQVNSRIAALKTGEVGAVESVPSDLTKDIGKDPNIEIYYAPGDKATYILINWKTAKDPKTGDPNPFLDVRVRRALNHALDIEALIENYMTGREKRTTMLGKNAIGYNPDVPFYDYNPEKARQLMADAGYAHGIKTQYFAWAGVTPIGEAMQKYWQDVGIQIEMKRTTVSVIWRNLMMKKDQRVYGLIPWGTGGGPDPGNWFKNSVLYNGAFAIHGQNDRVDEIARKQAREFDRKKRANLIDEAIQIIWKDAWFIPLWQGMAIKAVRTEWSYQDPPFTTGIVITNISKKE